MLEHCKYLPKKSSIVTTANTHWQLRLVHLYKRQALRGRRPADYVQLAPCARAQDTHVERGASSITPRIEQVVGDS